MECVLRTYGLTKVYKGVPVVNGVSMHVRRGDIYGFVGRNGAGKTTLMRLVGGLVNKSGGSYELFGQRDDGGKIDRARRRTGAIIETPSVFPEFTAEENLRAQCVSLGVDGKKIVPELL